MAQKSVSTDHQVDTLLSPQWKKSFQSRLLAWYRRHRRDLPWRRISDPYQIWISEIMLQQTQVATVVPYFERFVTAFPTIKDLARADENLVLRHWEGLGYYRRARQLHRAAQVVMNRFGGQFPRGMDAIRELPGIGRYTAGAVASIAFDQPTPILEANTVRLFSRLVAYRGDPAASAAQQLLWHVAEAVLPRRHCGAFNQALMELGSLVCVPRAPACQACPVRELCAAYQGGEQDRIPLLRAKPPSEAVHEAAVVVWHAGNVLLRQRTVGERWAGLWDFLRFPLVARRGSPQQREIISKIAEHSGLLVRPPVLVDTLKHGVTRFRITLDCYSVEFKGRKPKLSPGTWKWIRPGELETVPLSVTGRKIVRLIENAETAS